MITKEQLTTRYNTDFPVLKLPVGPKFIDWTYALIQEEVAKVDTGDITEEDVIATFQAFLALLPTPKPVKPPSENPFVILIERISPLKPEEGFIEAKKYGYNECLEDIRVLLLKEINDRK